MNMIPKVVFILAVTGFIAGCAHTSSVMDTGNGTYMISGHASPIRGGATGANDVAYADANKFCQSKGQDLHAIVLDANARDVYQASAGGNGNSFGGGVFAAGNVDMHFWGAISNPGRVSGVDAGPVTVE